MASIPLQNVTTVLRNAMRNGEAQNGPYRAVYRQPDDRLELYHYGTLIYQDASNQIEHLGGYSNSDRDAIKTAMYLRIPGNLNVSSAMKKPKWATREINGWWVG